MAESIVVRLRDWAAKQPGAPAVEAGEGRLTYAGLLEAAQQAAARLRNLGLQPGDRVAVALPSGLDFTSLWFGCAYGGFSFVPLNPALTGDQVRRAVALVRPALLVTPGQPSPTGVRTIDAAAFSTAPPVSAGPPAAYDPQAEALVLFTSGSTGESKGVSWTRVTQAWHGQNYLRDFVRLGPLDHAYNCLPLFHVTGMGFSLGTLLGGATLHLDARFEPLRFWRRLDETGARAFPFVGPMLSMLLARPVTARPSVARWAVGSATPKHRWQEFEERFSVRLIETYGQTEMAGTWAMHAPGDPVGTQGRLRGVEARVLDDGGEPVPVGGMGMLHVRPANADLIARGYVDAGGGIEPLLCDGWYATGDAVSMDGAGRITFRGRLRDVIRRRGELLSTCDIEAVVASHPGVHTAAAVPVAAAIGDEDVRLCVVPHPGVEIDPANLYRFCAERLPRFMLPSYIEVRDAFPLTPTGRVQKHQLAAEGLLPTAWTVRKAHTVLRG